MRLVYKPKDAEPREFPFDPDEVTAPEAELLERVGTGSWESFSAWRQAYRENRIRARRAAVWILLRREDPNLAFDSFAPMASQIDFAYDVDELLIIRKSWEGIDTDDARNQVAVVDLLLTAAGHTPVEDSADPEPAVGEGDPADPKPRPSRKPSRSRTKPPVSPAADESTGGTSPSD